MPVILGFDLSEMTFSAFSSRNMMDRNWPLRRERVVLYQLAMVICLVAECISTYSLDKYEKLQGHIENGYEGSHLYNNDLIDSQIVLIVFCVLVATIFGADFFCILMYPRRVFPRWYQKSKKFLAVIITLGTFAGALAVSIIVARNSAKISGLSPELIAAAISEYSHPPLRYRDWGINITFVVLIWIGLIFVVGSTYVMFLADTHDLAFGTDPTSIEKSSSQDSSEAVLPMTDRNLV